MLEIASIISSSLFQIILSSLLNEELDRFNEVQGMDTIGLVAPEIPDLFLQSALHQRSMTYHSFRHGDLHQIPNKNLEFSVECIDNGVYEDVGPFHKDKKTNNQSFSCKDMTFVLLKKGDTVTYPGVERVVT
ncbi:hypothetical protein BD770DRAFT_449572 [Pilaira anomala]|nr:hypothetical protein BD770DRAFT_449572 [Pilaira anomala]